jgi:chromate transporter
VTDSHDDPIPAVPLVGRFTWRGLRRELPVLSSVDWRAGLVAVLAFVLTFVWKRGMVTTLAACVLAGAALSALG